MEEWGGPVAGSSRSTPNGFSSCMLVITPVIIGTVLALHWSDDDICDAGFRQAWRWWLLLAHVVIPAANLLGSVAAAYCMGVSPAPALLPERQAYEQVVDSNMSRAGKLAGFFILINLIQFFLFVAGNVILFQSRSCDNAWDWPIYRMGWISIVVSDFGVVLWAVCMCTIMVT